MSYRQYLLIIIIILHFLVFSLILSYRFVIAAIVIATVIIAKEPVGHEGLFGNVLRLGLGHVERSQSRFHQRSEVHVRTCGSKHICICTDTYIGS